MKRKISLFYTILLIYLSILTALDAQSPTDSLPGGVISRFSHGDSVNTVAFSPDRQLLASGGDDNTVILWDVTDRRKLKVFTGPSKSVMSVVFSPDGKLLAAASLDGFVRLWDVLSKRGLPSLTHSGWVKSVAFSPDGKTLASGGGDEKGSVMLWDVPSKSPDHFYLWTRWYSGICCFFA